MASSLAVKRLLSSSGHLSRSLFRPAATASASRSFNTNAMRRYDEASDESDVDVDRRSDRRAARRDDFFSDVYDPFSPTRSLFQVLNTVDQLMNSPFITPPTRSLSQVLNTVDQLKNNPRGARNGWDARETEDALLLRVNMPGLGKEDVKIAVEQNTLTIRGEGPKESEEEVGGGLRYTSRIDLPDKLYKIDQIKAEMKNGVLKVTVPKMKEEERSDVFNVTVD
ncbi:heat shock 22 kDa protein, mitochondrial-like isoform X2 [Lotus japonicus]|uniref:heat shock 22 kDa protein, mitochondrial-like isoform X2 n=1 Tax=Lotus japonicus TaxID=34305 RepID=UPI00258B88F4|nr:heat shock 22 kDa protein, mitochondrial-like isoform X2 [Lotus japonicus]